MIYRFLLGAVALVVHLYVSSPALAQQWNLNCPGRWMNNYCVCLNGRLADVDYVGRRAYVCGPQAGQCDSGSYPDRGKCVKNGYALCETGNHACPQDQECTFAGCVPRGLAAYQKCSDGVSYCREQGQMCTKPAGSSDYACTSRFKFMQEVAARNERVRELWREQLWTELRQARNASVAEWAKEGGLIAGQAGTDIAAGAAADVLAPGWGTYYRGGVQNVTDVGIGEKTWNEATRDYATDSTFEYLGFGTPKLMYQYYNEYKAWWRSKPY